MIVAGNAVIAATRCESAKIISFLEVHVLSKRFCLLKLMKADVEPAALLPINFMAMVKMTREIKSTT